MILITGAAGKTGRAVIRALKVRKISIRALVREAHQSKVVKNLGLEEVVAGDMRSKKIIKAAMQGAEAVYHIPPNIIPDELNIGENLIETAQSEGVRHFVYHSVLHPQIEAMPHHWQKMRVEEQLFESGLAYTILQPAVYMQNILAHWDDIMRVGQFAVPYAASTRLSYVDLEDVAHAAGIVLCEPGHKGAIYEICGPDALTPDEIAEKFSYHTGVPINAKVLPIEEWRKNAQRNGMGAYQIDTLIKMFDYYEKCGFTGNPRVLECLLGRPPTNFDAFVTKTTQDQL